MRPRLAVLVPGAAAAVAVAYRLATVLSEVPNRHAFGWDAAKRATLDVEAADALRTFNLLRYLVYLAGPETWPTLRLALAAPLHALAGPSHALDVEFGVSIALSAALCLALAAAARVFAPDSGRALLLLLLSAALLAGNRALWVHSADGMLDVPSAVLTLAVAAAWVHSRQPQRQLWPLALCANLLFHMRWQQGMMLAGAVLAVEALQAGAGPLLRETVSALGRALKRPAAALALIALAATGMALWVAATGGIVTSLFSAREVYGPLSIAALAAFLFLHAALWRAELPARVRFVWLWVLTPMAAWLLVPGMRRLRVLSLTSFTYQSAERPATLAGKLAFYPDAVWQRWFAGETRWLVAAMLGGAIAFAVRRAEVRRVLVPLGAIIAVQLFGLLALSRHNFQDRFLLNLAPLVALGTAAWLLALKPVPAAALAIAAASWLAVRAAPLWERAPLAATLSEGFAQQAEGDACREAALQLPPTASVLLNRTGPERYMLCTMWFAFAARERSQRVDVHAVELSPAELVVLDDGSQAPLLLEEGRAPLGASVVLGPLTVSRVSAAGSLLR